MLPLKNSFIHLTMLVAVFILCSCTSPTVQRASSEFIPGKILTGIPVYPGAMPFPDVYPGFGPPTFPYRPGAESASAQYRSQDSDNQILVWYAQKLSDKGFSSDGGNSQGVASTRHA